MVVVFLVTGRGSLRGLFSMTARKGETGTRWMMIRGRGRRKDGFPFASAALEEVIATPAGLFYIHPSMNKNRCGSGAWAATQALGLVEVAS